MTAEPAPLAWVILMAAGREVAVPSAESWQTHLECLRRSRLVPLAAHLLQSRFQELHPDTRRYLEAATMMAESNVEQAASALVEIAARFDRRAIRWVVLKGYPLAARLYPRPSCRPSGDIDLLVDEPSLAAAEEDLVEAGYRAEGADRSYHLRLVRKGQTGTQVVELHHRAAPAAHGGPRTADILAHRRAFPISGSTGWLPSAGHEVDLLIRHYLRHAGHQAIWLVDLLLLSAGTPLWHRLGSPIGDDLERVGLPRLVDGPARYSLRPLRRWMARRTFEERHTARHISPVGTALALAESPGAASRMLARLAWPSQPTPRWFATSHTSWGRYTWRIRRLFKLGG